MFTSATPNLTRDFSLTREDALQQLVLQVAQSIQPAVSPTTPRIKHVRRLSEDLARPPTPPPPPPPSPPIPEEEELEEDVLRGGRVVMDVERHVVSVDDEPVSMPLKEFDLLEYLLRNSGRVLTRGQLIDRVWGADYVGDTKTLDVHIKRLRSKIEVHPSRPKHLVTVRGLGYKFEE